MLAASRPGRLNAFLEYLDMCRGDHMSTTIDGDIPAAVTPRTDGLLNVGNANDLFPPETVDIREEFRRFRDAPWAPYASEMEDNWDNRSLIYPPLRPPAGQLAELRAQPLYADAVGTPGP